MIGRPRAHHREVGSTNLLARDLATAGAPHGTLVTAGLVARTGGRTGPIATPSPESAVAMAMR